MHAPPPETKKAESRANAIQPSDHETSKGNEIMETMPHGVESVKRAQSRTTQIGSAERVRIVILLREMRRVLRASGRLPSLDSDDVNLNQAWIAIGSHLLHNSKVFNRTKRLQRAREWGAP